MIVLVMCEFRNGNMILGVAETQSIKHAYEDTLKLMLANGEEWYWAKRHVWVYPAEVGRNAWTN